MKTVLSSCFLSLAASVVLAGPIDGLLKDAEAARAFDYCTWAFDADGEPEPPDVEPIVEAERGTVPDELRTAAALVDAGSKVALASKSAGACRKEFRRGEKAYDTRLAKHRRQQERRSDYSPSDDPEIAGAQERISRHYVEDQAVRRTYIELRAEEREGAGLWAYRLAATRGRQVDDESTRTLTELLERWDWFDIPRFGGAISNRAWLLAQHADDHPELQTLVLERMEPHLETGGVKLGNYAYLWDRVAVNTGREQRYGTQPIWECRDGRLELHPIEDPESVDERRAEMGLNTVAEGLAEMSRASCP